MKPSNNLYRLTLPDVLDLSGSKRRIVIVGQCQASAANKRATSARRLHILTPQRRRGGVSGYG
jgi:hypothetical protein